jgi:hypothetical protein
MDHGRAFSVVVNESAPIVPRLFGGKPTGNKLGDVLRRKDKWWARGSNLDLSRVRLMRIMATPPGKLA